MAEIKYRSGTSITQFHYCGVTVELDSQWASEWYEARIEQFINDAAESGGTRWGWFWIDQRAGTTFRFHIGDGIGYAFTVRDYENKPSADQIISPLDVAN